MVYPYNNVYVLSSFAGETFFVASKVAWYLSQPSNLIVFLFAFGILLYWRGRTRAGMRFMAGAAVVYAIGGLSPLGNVLMLSLEGNGSSPHDTAENMPEPNGFIVLGGAIDTLASTARGEMSLTEAAERVTVPVALHRRYPHARIVFSGGDGALVYKSTPESEWAQAFFKEMGVDMTRVTLETESRTTYENALYTKQMLNPQPGQRWLLITSAFHMPRAHACFDAVGFETVPWPVDFRTRGLEDVMRFSPRASEGWRRIDLAVKEWIGIIAYRISGRC